MEDDFNGNPMVDNIKENLSRGSSEQIFKKRSADTNTGYGYGHGYELGSYRYGPGKGLGPFPKSTENHS